MRKVLNIVEEERKRWRYTKLKREVLNIVEIRAKYCRTHKPGAKVLNLVELLGKVLDLLTWHITVLLSPWLCLQLSALVSQVPRPTCYCDIHGRWGTWLAGIPWSSPNGGWVDLVDCDTWKHMQNFDSPSCFWPFLLLVLVNKPLFQKNSWWKGKWPDALNRVHINFHSQAKRASKRGWN